MKKVFEDDLIVGMMSRLTNNYENVELKNLDKAIDYLNSAAGIFEEKGLFKQSDKILSILSKIASDYKPKKRSLLEIDDGFFPIELAKRLQERVSIGTLDSDDMNPIIQELKKYAPKYFEKELKNGAKPEDIAYSLLSSTEDASDLPWNQQGEIFEFTDENVDQVNKLYNSGATKEQITRAIKNNIAPEWFHQEIVEGGRDQEDLMNELFEGLDLFKEESDESFADDRYSKNLTSKKMIDNLLDHGTEFNMSDDNLEISDDEDFED
jgi:hypothetical protein